MLLAVEEGFESRKGQRKFVFCFQFFPNPIRQFLDDIWTGGPRVDQQDGRVIVLVPDSATDRLIHRLHAEILVVFLARRGGGGGGSRGTPQRPIQKVHLFLELGREFVWVREAHHNDETAQIVGKVYAFAHFSAYNGKDNCAGQAGSQERGVGAAQAGGRGRGVGAAQAGSRARGVGAAQAGGRGRDVGAERGIGDGFGVVDENGV